MIIISDYNCLTLSSNCLTFSFYCSLSLPSSNFLNISCTKILRSSSCCFLKFSHYCLFTFASYPPSYKILSFLWYEFSNSYPFIVTLWSIFFNNSSSCFIIFCSCNFDSIYCSVLQILSSSICLSRSFSSF